MGTMEKSTESFAVKLGDPNLGMYLVSLTALRLYGSNLTSIF